MLSWAHKGGSLATQPRINYLRLMKEPLSSFTLSCGLQHFNQMTCGTGVKSAAKQHGMHAQLCKSSGSVEHDWLSVHEQKVILFSGYVQVWECSWVWDSGNSFPLGCNAGCKQADALKKKWKEIHVGSADFWKKFPVLWSSPHSSLSICQSKIKDVCCFFLCCYGCIIFILNARIVQIYSTTTCLHTKGEMILHYFSYFPTQSIMGKSF